MAETKPAIQYALSTDNDAVGRLLAARGISPEDFVRGDAKMGRNGLIHPEGRNAAFAFVRFYGYENPWDNGFMAYLVTAQTREAAVEDERCAR